MDEVSLISDHGSPKAETPGTHDPSSTISSHSPSPTSSDPSSSLSTSILPQDTELTSLEEVLARLTVKEDQPGRMFVALSNIFRAAQDRERSIDLSRFGSDGPWTLFQRADTSSQHGYRDLEALRAIKDITDQMHWRGSQLLVAVAKALADASRDSAWRIPFGETGILDSFLVIVGTEHIDGDLALHSLRLIGNTCVDVDENRQRLIESNSLRSIIRRLEDSQLSSIAIPVIYNICADYDPAQRSARANGLGPSLVNLLSRDSIAPGAQLSYTCRLLDYCLEDFNQQSSPIQAVEILLKTASVPGLDVDDCVSLVDAAIVHLKEERFQSHAITQQLLDLPLAMLFRSCPSQQHPDFANAGVMNVVPPVRDAEEEEELSRMRRSLIDCLSDVSASPEFAVSYADVHSPLIGSLLNWLSVPQAQLQLCSCIMLGNLARSDQTCNAIISQLQIHTLLAPILKSGSDTQVLHSALGFMRNLGLPLENKQILGEADIIVIISRFWTSEVLPLVAHAAVSLTRQMINGSLPNVRKLLAPLSPDPESPAHTKTYLSLLLSLFDNTDDMTIKLEVARVIAAILRTINSAVSSDLEGPVQSILDRLYLLHPDISRPVSMMVTQSQWQIVRSEGWFALALMARSAAGSAAIDAALQQVEFFAALEQTIRGQSSLSNTGSSVPARRSLSETVTPERSTEPESMSSQEKDMRAKDRENAMVLVHELLKNRGDDMADIRRNALDDLLQGGESQLSTEKMMNKMTRGN